MSEGSRGACKTMRPLKPCFANSPSVRGVEIQAAAPDPVERVEQVSEGVVVRLVDVARVDDAASRVARHVVLPVVRPRVGRDVEGVVYDGGLDAEALAQV